MKCPNCNTRFNIKYKFCPKCGKMLSEKKLKSKKRSIKNKINTKSTLKEFDKKSDEKYLVNTPKKNIALKDSEEKKINTEIEQTNDQQHEKLTKTEKELNKFQEENKIKKTEQNNQKDNKIKKSEQINQKEQSVKKTTLTFELKNYNNKELEIIHNTTKEVKERALKWRFNFPSIPELNLYHAVFSDVYFLYDYIASGRRKLYEEQNIKLSESVEEIVKINKMLIDYKYHDKNEDFFTDKLLEAIKKIYNNYFKDKDGIALLSIPPSKKNVTPQTKKSIDLIVEWCEDDKSKLDFEIYNTYDTLTREKNVKSSKEGDKRVEKHLDSIKYNRKDEFSNFKLGLIILDDITTTGNTMYACKDILIDNGHQNEDIISLAFARTVNNNELLATNEGVTIIGNPKRVERWKDEEI